MDRKVLKRAPLDEATKQKMREKQLEQRYDVMMMMMMMMMMTITMMTMMMMMMMMIDDD
jgi:hypothetical protein